MASYARVVGTIGDTNEAWNGIRGIDQGYYYSSKFQRPTNSFWDDLNWTKGKHTLQIRISDVPHPEPDFKFDERIQQRLYELPVAQHLRFRRPCFLAPESVEEWLPACRLEWFRHQL